MPAATVLSLRSLALVPSAPAGLARRIGAGALTVVAMALQLGLAATLTFVSVDGFQEHREPPGSEPFWPFLSLMAVGFLVPLVTIPALGWSLRRPALRRGDH